MLNISSLFLTLVLTVEDLSFSQAAVPVDAAMVTKLGCKSFGSSQISVLMIR